MTSTPRHRDRGSRENHRPKLPREDRSSSASQDSGTRVSWGPLLDPRPAPHRCLPSVGLSTVPLRWPPGCGGVHRAGLGRSMAPVDASACAMLQKTHRLVPLLGGPASRVLPWEAVADLGREASSGHLALDSRPQPGSSTPKGRVCPGRTGDLQGVSIKPNGILVSFPSHPGPFC